MATVDVDDHCTAAIEVEVGELELHRDNLGGVLSVSPASRYKGSVIPDKADLGRSIGDDDPRPRCNPSGQGQEEEYATSIGASLVPSLLRRRLPQGLFIGAAIVAATVYVIYRIRRKRRGSRQRKERSRRRWWHFARCGAAGGKNGREGDGNDGDRGGGANGDRREGEGEDINPDPDPDHGNAELFLNSPELWERIGCSDVPATDDCPALLANVPEVDEHVDDSASERKVMTSLKFGDHADCSDATVLGQRVEYRMRSHESSEFTRCGVDLASEEISERRTSSHDADEGAGCSDGSVSKERVQHRGSSRKGGKHNGPSDEPAFGEGFEHRIGSRGVGERTGYIADLKADEITEHGTINCQVAGSPDPFQTRELSFKSDNKSDSSTEDLLADVDSLIHATPPSRPPGLETPPGYRSMSGAEIDALVNLTHRVLRREPEALNQIAEDSYQCVAPFKDSDALHEIVEGSDEGVGPVAKSELADGSPSMLGMGTTTT